jgi:hypothetical protein
MDFSKLDSRTAAEKPQQVHLRNPATGEYIMDGDKPCVVLVVGSHSRSVQAGILDDARAKLNASKGRKKTKDEQANALADVQKTLVEGATRVIRGFVNISRGDVPLTTSADDLAWFLDLNFLSVKSLMATGEDDESDVWRGDSFAQQILKASNDAGAYLGNA